MMKRGIACLAVLLAALLLCAGALADETWQCPNCGQQSSGNFCSNCGTPRPADDDGQGDYLFSWNGFTAELLGVRTDISSTGRPHLYLDLRLKNGTPYDTWLDTRDVTINGADVTGSGVTHFEAGGEQETDISFWPSFDNEPAIQAICNPRTMTMKLLLMKQEDFEELHAEVVTLPLTSVPSMTPMPTDSATPAPTPRPTIKITYRTLVKGDSGEAVRNLQYALIRLGYLAGSADGKFGNQTMEAVREFAKANGLSSHDIATPEMQEVLFSGSAKAYEEPWVPLVIPSDSNGQWKKVSGNKMNFRFQVTNKSRTHTIRTFEVRVYALNAWGERIYGERTYYYDTNSKTVAPGKTVYCNYLTLPNRSEIDRLYACVSRVVFSDGTTRENPETNDYSDWWQLNN